MTVVSTSKVEGLLHSLKLLTLLAIGPVRTTN